MDHQQTDRDWGSDEPKQPPSLRSEIISNEPQRRLEKARAALRPVEPKEAMAELAACLTLVAPAGMSADDRKEWLKVACVTIRDIPASALKEGCEAARKSCRRVSDVVPTIIEGSRAEIAWLRSIRQSAQDAVDYPPQPRSCAPPRADDRPLTAQELADMTPGMRRICERNNIVEPDVLAEANRIIEQRFGEHNSAVGAKSTE